MICDIIYNVYLCKYTNFEVFESNRAGETMYDIHCHIIPYVDDGSGSIIDSVEMASLAAKAGVKAIIATPHSNIPDIFENYWNDSFDQKLLTLNTELSKREIDIKIYPGQEIFYRGDILAKLRSDELITLNKSRYALLEFDFKTPEAEAYSVVKELVSVGYVPIVAHLERYAFAFENSASILKLKKCGALIQLNAQSIIGGFGRYPKLVAEYILENELADFVASDAHSQYTRTPDMSEAHEFVCGKYSYEYADILFSENPFKVIKNIEIR